MTGGRANAGFARGYQRRWVDIMAQQTHGIQGALPNQHDAIDHANRLAFEENFRLIKQCWTEEMLTYDGTFWKVPAGPTPWPLETTQKWGKGVQDGLLTAVGGVPKPLQKPHPPLFQPFASSEHTVRFCAQEDVTPILPPLHPVYEKQLYRVYAEVAGKPTGRDIGVLRDVIIADSDAEARALWQDSGQFSGRAWFEPFGFRKGMQDPQTGQFPTAEEVVAQGYAYVGTVDTVLRAMEAQQQRQPVDWVFCYTYNSLVPHPVLMHSIETFWTKVMPRFQ
jgi:alkanesulfonate monooxygenase SsuD/methylene tetrahydromethanopterin reductase-like flavin-dependent oxidoreductase (luciferase family)